MIDSSDILNPTEQKWLVEAIREAEADTTGEIRVHIEDFSLDYPLERASELFAALGMENTRFRNGVLIYVSASQHGLAIIGDMGINQYVHPQFWDSERNILEQYFKKTEYFEGLAIAIKRVGSVLKTHFPKGDDHNPNELPNEISY